MKTQLAPNTCASRTPFTLPAGPLCVAAFSVMLGAATSRGQGLDTDSPLLPPAGEYSSPEQFHQYSQAGIILDDPVHVPFTDTAQRVVVGNDEREIFESEFRAVEIGQGLGKVVLTGPVEVLTRDRNLSTTGLFDTEIVSMSLSGNVPGMGQILIREDPRRASTGRTDVIDLGGGLYHIDSFFDVFTQLSVDGGDTWIASDSSTRMELGPLEKDVTIEVDVFPETVGQLLVELPPAPGLVTPNPGLPPIGGVYLSVAQVHAEYHGPDLDIILQDIRHRPLADPPPMITTVGADEQQTFQSALLAEAVITSDTLGLEGEIVQMELAGPVQMIVLGKADTATGSFQAEIVEMTLIGDISDGPPVIIREAPTQASSGRTTITDLGGGLYHIDSFFDVFTELSVDGGNTWIAAAAPVRVQLAQPGIVAKQPELPPTDGVYQGAKPAEFLDPELKIVLLDLAHQAFADGIERVAVGPDEVETFQSSLTATALATIPAMGLDGTPLPVELTGPVQTRVSDKVGNTTGDFQAEIVSMTLSGEVLTPGGEILPMMMRESPTQPSLGMTSINDRGNGEFPVESFFDVFVEMSVDGGQSWIAAEAPVRMELSRGPQLIPLVGPAEVHVFFEGPNEGDAQDHDRDGLDEVPTELVSLDLKGMTPQGPIQATLRRDRPSLGQIEELLQVVPGTLDVDPFTANTLADSFFDVWTEITLGGRVLVTDRPLHIETIIDHKPPQDGERYLNPNLTRVELIDAFTGQGTGIYVRREIHQPDPTIEFDYFPRTNCVVTLAGGPIGAAPASYALQGPAEVHVYFEGPTEGDAIDDDSNGRDEVVQQLVSMNLTDGAVTLRVRDVSKSPFGPSLGQIEELVNNNPGRLDLDPFHPGDAESIFDVLFEIELPGGIVLHNEKPLRIGAMISEKPWITCFDFNVGPDASIELFNENNEPSGISLLNGRVFCPDGTIIVEKQSNPPGATGFEFSSSWSPNFNLDDGQTYNSGPLAPGTYSVNEINLPAGWELTSAICDNGSDPSAIVLDPGETVTVTFTNEQITVEIDEFPVKVENILLETESVLTQDPSLPSTEGAYRTAGGVQLEFNGPELHMVLQDLAYRPSADPPPVVSNVGADEHATFEASFLANAEVTSDALGLDGELVQMELAGPAKTVVLGKADTTTGSFQEELVEMTLIGDIPAGQQIVPIAIRESPTQASTGRTTITDLGGGLYHIDSFFDVFTELSVDGGNSWIASSESVRVTLARRTLITAVGTAVEHVFFEGPTEGDAHDNDNNGLDEVNSELVSLDLHGQSSQGPVAIRLRSDRQSFGQIEEQVNNTPGRLDLDPFHPGVADSFFDVWTEITVGGQMLVTNSPLRLETIIAQKPPRDGERYVSGGGVRVELIDPATGEGTGIYIIRQVNQPDPTIEVDYFPETNGMVTLAGGPIGAAPASYALRGPAEVHVFFEGPNEGDAVDDDFNGLDEVVQQLILMKLTDGNVTLRVRDISKSPFSPSLGQIEELVNNNPDRLDLDPFHPGDAESFFDVLFEIELPDGTVLHNERPARIESVISEKPWITCFDFNLGPNDQIALLDESNEPSGVFLVEGRVFCPDGTIIVKKQTDPDGAAGQFEFSSNFGPNFTLGDDETYNSGPLAPGTYSVSEINLPAGWELTSAICDDGSDPSAIVLDPGETVTVTFTNSRLTEIAVEQPPGVDLPIGSMVDCGSLAVGHSTSLDFLVLNHGTANLSIVGTSLVGPNAAEFAVTTAPAGTVIPGGSTPMVVTFAPGGPGMRTAKLLIDNNDPDENPFTIDLEGTGLPANTFGNWIVGFPCTGAQTGFDDDPDLDRIPNGLENFFDSDPCAFSTGLDAGRLTGNTFTFTHPQNPSPAANISPPIYRWSTDLKTFNADGASNAAGTITVTFSAALNTPTPGTTTVTATITATDIPDRLFVDLGVELLP